MKYIGIDNGVTGSIAIIEDGKAYYFQMPTKSEQSYTKSKQNITRIEVPELKRILESAALWPCKCLLERPMVNPGRFKATTSALRALEATLIVLEDLRIPYQYIDSKEWQKALLPRDMGKVVITKSGKSKRKVEPAELKAASLDIARRMFPGIELKHDGDSLLIAEYLRRQNVQTV